MNIGQNCSFLKSLGVALGINFAVNVFVSIRLTLNFFERTLPGQSQEILESACSIIVAIAFYVGFSILYKSTTLWLHAQMSIVKRRMEGVELTSCLIILMTES